jgi:hypothetical protein
MPTVEPALKMWSRAGSTADAQDSFRRMKATFTEAYQVVHSTDATVLDVYLAQGLPQVGQPYPNTDFVLAKKGVVSRVSPILSIVTIAYEGEIAPQNGNGQPSTNPIFAPPTIDWANATEELEIDTDARGKPICTVIGEEIKGVKRRFTDQVLTIQRNFLYWDEYVQNSFMDTVNDKPIRSWPAGTGLLIDLSAKNVIAEEGGYWKGTMRIHFRRPYLTTPDKAWWFRTVHQGFYERQELPTTPDADGNYPFARVLAVDKNKQPVKRPVRLDQYGKQIEENANSYWLEIERYLPADHHSLGFL